METAVRSERDDVNTRAKGQEEGGDNVLAPEVPFKPVLTIYDKKK